MSGYPPNPRSTVNRYRGRAAYDYQTIHTLVNSCPILHVSFNPSLPEDDPFPTILPMIGAMGSFPPPPSQSAPPSPTPGPLDLYLHGYVSSRLMRLPPTANPTSSSAEEAAEEAEPKKGLPLCISATHLDGLILALTPHHHSLNYRSAILHGRATLLTSPAEKLYAMELITDNLIPPRWANTRVPPTAVEMQSTSILRVEIVSASAKVREGGPGEDRRDERDEGVRGRVWTGVVPVWSVLGEPVPVPGEGNRVGGVPGHVKALVEGWNGEGERRAREAVEGGKKR
ncbi:hypothetical protein MMC24_003040 [Lignoscripta atroalba]|nr:hypothetical protein [Lignoscripta atroalba]